MFSKTTIFGLVMGCIIGFCAVVGAEEAKPVPASLDAATTFEEIQAYVEHAFSESRKNLITMEDQERFYETYPPIGIAGGRKIIALGGDDESLDYGYGILLAALNWHSKIHPDAMKEFEKVVEEIKGTGKFSELIDSARFYLFYHQCRLFADTISANTFVAVKDDLDALKEKAKELASLKTEHGHYEYGPIARVLDLAQEISIANGTPHLVDDVLEDLVRFLTSDRLTSDRFEKKKENEAFLRGYRRRVTGSPFELWGKTVEGNDFNWADYQNKIVLIDFTAYWCGPCRQEMPNIVEMYEQYHDKGLEVICVGTDDTTDNLKKMIEEDKIAFTMISEELSKGDERGVPSEYYGIQGIPDIFLIGKDGRIITSKLRGPTLRDAIEKQFVDKGKRSIR